MNSHLNRRQMFAGALLILLGIVFLIQQIFGWRGDFLILLAIGGAFIAGYFFTRNYGLLIPGCILTGLAIGDIGEKTLTGFDDFGVLGLGIGFLLIYLIDLVYRKRNIWWPLLPGGVLVLIGLASASGQMAELVNLLWPILLILVGVLVLFGILGRRGKQGPSSPVTPSDPEDPNFKSEQ